MVFFEITQTLAYANEFRNTFGMRYTGLADPGNSVYYAYRVPDAPAPYPQDYVIDQNRIVRHWAAEYLPQETKAAVDALLGFTSVPSAPGGGAEGGAPPRAAAAWLSTGDPNPFRESTRIRWTIAAGGPVDLAIFDARGRRVRTLAREMRDAGEHQSVWDGRDEHGRAVPAGVYWLRLAGPGGGRGEDTAAAPRSAEEGRSAVAAEAVRRVVRLH